METTGVDPRWNRQSSGQVAGERTVSSSSSFNARSPSQAESATSIVFSADWVTITTPIGEGAFSRVYEGVYSNPETLEQSVVAVKILKKNMLKRRADCLRFIKEAKIMTKISQRNIVACYGIGKYDDNDAINPGSLFIVQELVRGGNLLHKVYKQMLNRNAVVYTSQEALSWMVDVAAGMQYLHQVTDVKPMIIHRDLKLENIMLAPAPRGGTLAKLVDFGLHKVIDDRIKKVVKRVASMSLLGGARLPPIRGAADDGLEDALDLEAELVLGEGGAAAGGGSPAGATMGLLTTSGLLTAAGAQLNKDGVRPLTVDSRRASASGSRLSMASHKEEDEEAAGAAGGPDTSPTSDPRSRLSPPRALKSPLSRGVSRENMFEKGSLEGCDADGTRHHDTPKRQSSMQRLIAKMKEIKMRVIGGPNNTSQPSSPRPTSRENSCGSLPRDVGRDGSLPRESPNQTSLSLPKDVGTSQQSGSRVPEHLPPLPNSTSSAAASPGNSSQAVPPVDVDKIARNEALLNRILAQQSVARGEGQGAAGADDSSLPDPVAARAGRKPAPRRAVTWVNEIRYNLTEAVGSWAYMAPEVVLGHPYNEKVDVFSFGVILFEVLHRKLMLVDEIKNDPRKDAQMYAERVARGFRPEIPRRWPEKLRTLIAACWHQDAHVRPNFVAVVDLLQELQRSGAVAAIDAQTWSNGSVYI